MSDPTDALLASAAPSTTTVSVCGRGDLVDEHNRLSAELAQVRGETLAGGSGAAKVAEQIRAIEADIDASSVTYTLRSISRKQYADLLAKHAPSKEDRLAGYTYDPRHFPQALIAATVAEPTITPAQSDQLAEKLPPGEWNKLWYAVLGLNMSGIDPPKSEAAAAILRANDGSLATPPNGASQETRSSDGSGGASPPTSTTTTVA